MKKLLLGLGLIGTLGACAEDPPVTGGTGLNVGDLADINGDGKPDGRIAAGGMLDTNGDGVGDVPAAGAQPLANWPSVGQGVDLNGDGMGDGTAIDTNGDTIADAVDTNGDQQPDQWLIPPTTSGDGAVGDGDFQGDGIVPADGDDSGDGDDQGCGAITKEAEIVRGPVDIVWVIDSSGSMGDEFLNVLNNLSMFATSIQASGVDAHVVMMHLFGVAGDPLANTPLGMDANSYRYHLVNVDSWNALTVLLNEYDGGNQYGTFLRPDAPKHFVVVSDDNSSPLFGGTLAADFEPQMKAKLGGDFFLHAVVADGQNGCFGTNVGSEYLTLADSTGGEKLSICASDWSLLFAQLEQAVVESAPLPCDFEIPPPPEGKNLDPEAVQVLFTPSGGAESEFGRASGAEACGDNAGWHYDDPSAPTRIEFCPTACEQVKSGGAVSIGFGCKPSVVF